MPSDSNGLYSLPAGYLATTGLTILASQHNPPLEDIAAGLTARLMRSGVAPMTGPLWLADGVEATPGLSFNSAKTTGLFKSTLGMGVSVGGSQVMDFGTSATFKDGGDIASANALTLGTGNVFNITGTTAVTSIGTKGIGTICWLRFDGILTLTHHATDLILTTGTNITTAAGDWGIFEEYASGDWRMIGYVRASGAALVASLPRGYIDGCKLSNGTDTTNDINITAGTCRDSTNTADIVIATALGKQLDANWTVGGTTGTPLGGRNSAAGIADGTYHVYAVRTAASSAADIYFYKGVAGTDAEASATYSAMLTALQAESGGTLYVYARRLGSIVRASSTLFQFVQRGDNFEYNTPQIAYTSAPGSTNAVTATLSTAPLGIATQVNVTIGQAGAGDIAYASALTQSDQSPSTGASPLTSIAIASHGAKSVWTDTSGRIRYRSNDASTTLNILVNGYTDLRGKDA